ncbi:hypothetical protein RRG08_009898 [Elysia crispata]|uniref:MULE transposase domain-containing protein n=1 Tax=Elysia crispata TaxID=231223 RepID=A0AAE0Y9G1_9GAST|nr:hypothetical protein RRG08_009898 [Elysia crispata]
MKIDSDIVLFSTPPLLHQLYRSGHVFIDGTFKFCRTFYLQIYSLHVWENGIYLPCAFLLLLDKRQSTYERVLTVLHSECFEQQTAFKPEYIHLDLEVGMMNAFKTSFPSSTIKPCQYRIAQTRYRFINQVLLSLVYKSGVRGDHTAKWLKTCFVLTALDPDNFENAFHFTLIAEVPEIQSGDRFDQFLVCLHNNYRWKTSKFTPSLWASQDTHLRRNNAYEACHSRFAKSFKSPHTNVF